MNFSAWKLSHLAILMSILIGEVFFPISFVRIPFVEVVMLTIASTTFLYFHPRSKNHQNVLEQPKTSRAKRKNDILHEVTFKHPAKTEPKQLTLPENTHTFERHVVHYLLQQLDRMNFHHKDFALSDMHQVVQQPQAWLKANLWPVVTFPQRKMLRYRVDLQIRTPAGFKTCPSFNGVADLLLCLQAMHTLQGCVQEPLMMDFPMSALDYPKLVQSLFDCLEKKDSSFFQVLWLVNDMNERHRMVWQRLRELGLTFAECLVAPQVNIASPYAHMNWDVFEKYNAMEEYRSMPTSMRRFVSQSTHIILGNVPSDASVAMPFDSIYGPFAGECEVVLGEGEPTPQQAAL